MPRLILPTTFGNPRLPSRDLSLFNDTFNGRSGSIGSTPSGQAWQLYGATATVVSDAAVPVATVDSTQGAVLLNGAADGILTAVLKTTAQYNTQLILRGVDQNNFLALKSASNTDLTTWRLVHRTAGAESTLQTNVGALASNQTVQVTMNGTAITIKIDGVQSWTGTATQFATATKQGFGTIRTSALGIAWDSIKMEQLP